MAACAQYLLGDKAKKNAADYVLNLDSPIPPQSVSLKVTQNKVQLISLIMAHLWEPVRLILSGEQYVIVSGLDDEHLKIRTVVSQSEKYVTLRNCHEKADTIMIQQNEKT